MQTLLHVGCGSSNISALPRFFSAGGWSEIRYDLDPDVQPDVVGDSRDLSLFETGSIDAVFSSHNIEHVSSFDVPVVLREFRRVLRAEGLLVVMCPDIESVAQAIVERRLEQPLYTSPAGPITAVDILYGFQRSIQAGNEYMAHKMAFTADTLAGYLLDAGFSSATILRDTGYGLTALACCQRLPLGQAQEIVKSVCSQPECVSEGRTYGDYAP